MGGGRVICGDAADLLGGLPGGSVDVIFTDPPYVKDQWRDAYQILADHAARVLRPSGFLVTYAGQYHLADVMQMLGASGLSWFWMLGQVHKASASVIHPRNILCQWKPILVYQRPPIRPCPHQLMDIVKGKWTRKRHPWEQSFAISIDVLSRIAIPGMLVCDPFMGTGTNMLAARLLDMEYIGAEIDPETFAMAVSKLEQEPLAGRAVAEVTA